MEILLINVPEQKSTLVKQFLKELGVTIQNQTKARKLAEEINQDVKSGPNRILMKLLQKLGPFDRNNNNGCCNRLQYLDNFIY